MVGDHRESRGEAEPVQQGEPLHSRPSGGLEFDHRRVAPLLQSSDECAVLGRPKTQHILRLGGVPRESSRSGVNKKLSVVVPSRDAAPWVGELLESVLAQGIVDCEVLVVDNGSTDGTAELVTQFAAADSRVRLVQSDATSAGAARNEGIAAASGEYLVFADSDDIVPDGAYQVMLDALDASGSDMVIGDHLKFSPTATWSPTARWQAFDGLRTAVLPDDATALLTGRACWNRMIRRTFWDRVGLCFPEIASVDDIEPMTRAFVNASRVDVVPDQVYLYRDRSDGSSISQNADAHATVLYLEQELACARLVENRPAVRQQHAEMVFDADGWAHLARFVASGPSDVDIAAVDAALTGLVQALPGTALAKAAPARRLLWDLVLSGQWSAASEFVIAVQSGDGLRRLDAWRSALLTLRNDASPHTTLGSLVEQGLMSTLVNDADAVPRNWLEQAVQELRTLPSARTEPGLLSAMADAVARGDVETVAAVSGLRHFVPLTVRYATPTETGLEVGGDLPADRAVPQFSLVLQAGPEELSVPVMTTSGSWRATIEAGRLGSGRWTVGVGAAGIEVEFPVVTGRMPLPPIGEAFPIQPLADRKNGWRFLVDRRIPRRRGLASLLARAGRKLR
ncbi:hypothetical protein DEI89_05890 [Curtobacterium sp. MCBD17_030]|nr:hypothetical protein DEI89_05890 [Curtobacterium sp. MCBD17_030]